MLRIRHGVLYLLLRGAAALTVPVLGAVLHVGEVPLRLAGTVLVGRLDAGGGGGGCFCCCGRGG